MKQINNIDHKVFISFSEITLKVEQKRELII